MPPSRRFRPDEGDDVVEVKVKFQSDSKETLLERPLAIQCPFPAVDLTAAVIVMKYDKRWKKVLNG